MVRTRNGWSAIAWEHIDRLAKFEDTGVEPSEILTGFELAKIAMMQIEFDRYYALGTVEELSELVKAKQDGRAPILPCKVGDTVFFLGSNGVSKMRVGNVFPSGCIIKGKLCNAYLVTDYSYKCVTIADFGKTVFLTPEEAEAKLKEGLNK